MEQLKQHLHTGGGKGRGGEGRGGEGKGGGGRKGERGGRGGEGRGRGGRGGERAAVYIRLALDLKVYCVYMEKVTFSGSKLQTVSTYVRTCPQHICVTHTHTHTHTHTVVWVEGLLTEWRCSLASSGRHSSSADSFWQMPALNRPRARGQNKAAVSVSNAVQHE